MKHLAVAVLVACVTGCATTNPVYKQRTDELLLKTGSHREGPPSSYAPPTWKPGSWMAYKIVSDGRPSYHKLSVLSRDQDGFWLQTETYSYEGKSVSKVLYRDMPKSKDDVSRMLRRVVMQNNEEAPQTVDFEDPNNPLSGMYRSMMSAVNVTVPGDVSGAPRETATVTAGTFEGCAKVDGSWSFGPISQQVTSWWHPNVPVNGAVKGTSTDGRFSLELLDYGWTGATDVMP
jgi:hypothetical protein